MLLDERALDVGAGQFGAAHAYRERPGDGLLRLNADDAVHDVAHVARATLEQALGASSCCREITQRRRRPPALAAR